MKSPLWIAPSILIVFPLFAQQDPAPPAAWTATTSLSEPRHSSCAAKLADGRILITGGSGVNGDLDTAEIYSADGTFVSASSMAAARSHHSCTVLRDGRVLVAGGDTGATGSAELFDPPSGAWQTLGAPGVPRSGHTATLLQDGRVLLAGGAGVAAVEIFDPFTATLTQLDATLAETRDQHGAVLLDDGTVLLVGGRGDNGPVASTELFNPLDFSISPGPPLTAARAGHSVTRLDDSTILVAGGFDGNAELNSAEWFDPAVGTWKLLDVKMNTARRDHLAILIPGNGGVLIAGGLAKDKALAATELFQPIEGTFLALGPLTAPRAGLSAAAVDAGMILAAGGLNESGPQSACGILLVPAISFTKTLYRPGDTMQASGSNFRPSTTITLSLNFFNGSVGFGTKGRLLTSTVTTPPGSQFQVFAGFGAVPIVVANSGDVGKTAQLVAQTSTGITATATVPVRLPSTLSLTLPTATLEGLNATVTAQLVRPSGFFPMTGSITLNAARQVQTGGTGTSITDGSSNTINVAEGTTPAPTPTPVNTVGTSILVQKQLTGLLPGTFLVNAQYSGDAGQDPASATGSFLVASKTPVLDLTAVPALGSSVNQVGVPLTLNAVVHTNIPLNPPRIPSGTVTFFTSGFALGNPVSGVALNSIGALVASQLFTPLSVGPLNLTATYSGDGTFRTNSSSVLPLSIVKATPVLTFSPAPATYQCDQPSTFGLTLAFPPAIGLTNRTVALQANLPDGSVRSLGTSATGTLTPSAANLGTATAAITTTLPLDSTRVVAVFGGDALLNVVSSLPISPTLQKSSAAISFNSPPATITGTGALSVRVTATGCSATPTGSLELLDGGASVAIAQLGTNATVLLPASEQSVDTVFNVSRPVGVHNLQVVYSGDAHYQRTTSSPVTITFQ